MAELDNSTQQIPTFGIAYACLTSFDIDSDVKQVIASRWLVQNKTFSSSFIRFKTSH